MMMLHQEMGDVRNSNLSKSWIIRKIHITGICTPNTMVPQKLRGHIDGTILKQIFFNGKNIFFQCIMILSTKKRY